MLHELTLLRETTLNNAGQVVIPAFFRKYHIPDDNKISIYQTKIDSIEAIVLIPTAKIQNKHYENLKKIQ